MNKKGFLDLEVIMQPAFAILLALAWVATIVGYKWSLNMDAGGFPLYQIIIIMVVELIAVYVFVARE